MTTLRKTAVLTISACLLIGAALYLVLPAPRSPILPLGLTFIGFTNSPAQELVAVFAVSNSNDRAISFFAALPQVSEVGVWARDIVRPPPAWGTELAAHQETQFPVVVPSNGEAWKVPVLWSFGPTPGDRVRAVFRDNWLALRDRRSLPGLHVHIGLTGQTTYTAAITR